MCWGFPSIRFRAAKNAAVPMGAIIVWSMPILARTAAGLHQSSACHRLHGPDNYTAACSAQQHPKNNNFLDTHFVGVIGMMVCIPYSTSG